MILVYYAHILDGYEARRQERTSKMSASIKENPAQKGRAKRDSRKIADFLGSLEMRQCERNADADSIR